MKRLFFTLLFLSVFLLSSNAQQLQFKNYKVEDGLISNETHAILQDSKDRIWISSIGGVSCFNGKTFKNYTTENGLTSNISFSIFEDSKQRIWVGTLNKGVCVIQDEKVVLSETFETKFLGSANSFLEAKDGTIYIVFARGIASYKNGKWEKLDINYNVTNNATLLKSAWYDDNTIFITSSNKGVFKLTLDTLKLENIYSDKDGINKICYSILIDDDKVIWLGTYGSLCKIDKGKITNYNFNLNEFDLNRVYDILEENENELYLAFEGNGFGVFNKETGKIIIYNEKQGMPSKYIYSIIKDTEGNHWMTSYGEGIIRFRDTSFKIYNKEQGMPSNFVNDFLQWDDQLIIATDAGAIAVTSPENVRYFTDNKPVTNLFITPENTLLASTNQDVKEYSKNKPPKVIDTGVYNLIYKDEDRTLLFETSRIKAITKDSTYFINSSRSVGVVPIGDRLILCKISGLHQLHNNKVSPIPGIDFYKHNNFRSIDVISENEIIAGNEKNFYYIKLENEEFKIKVLDISRLNNLNYFRALKVDDKDLWVAGRDVFYKIDLKLLLEKDSISSKHFNTVSHFLENDIDFNSLHVTHKKTVVASSINGIITFREDEYLQNFQPPRLNLSDVFLFSEPLEDSLYRSSNRIILPFQKNYLTFLMEAITFTNPEKVKYKYRMIGLRDGDEWSPATSDPKAVFSFLPPGDYTFEFIADNGIGNWQSKPYQYNFTIKLPFWRTGWFWFSLLTLISLGVFISIYFKNKQEQKRNENYTHNLIKAQEQERIRVARELHDSVGQKLMLLTKKTKSLGNIEMESLAGNTLDELRTISRGLHPATLEKLGPTAAIIKLINEVDDNTNIFFTHEIEDIDALLSKDASLHLYRIIQEVLNNMIKHSDAKAAYIKIVKKNNFIETTIVDNGKGFDSIDKLKFNNSLGMQTIVERAKILNSKIDIKSQINKGTQITLSTPL
ncbi:sensor histidine kinase [Aequorivita xiaoshiensis]|uniref:histidine kinase n=1 Tax=Aequorivita xiaoshiensis TaxID=2874476 RepID=A0A9X1R149_9FLAO|nr:sensor histidine kinase [Aequorivita xiaoshiensis]MCG2429907.1 histidine kinase [Aequorivita xiaoshiensis]